MVHYVVEVIFSDVSKDNYVFVKHSKNKYVYTPVTYLSRPTLFANLPLLIGARLLSRQYDLKL